MSKSQADVQYLVYSFSFQLYINNEWVDAVDGATIEVEDPATRKIICRVAEGKKVSIQRSYAVVSTISGNEIDS